MLRGAAAFLSLLAAEAFDHASQHGASWNTAVLPRISRTDEPRDGLGTLLMSALKFSSRRQPLPRARAPTTIIIDIWIMISDWS
jgi:hypothetical protein